MHFRNLGTHWGGRVPVLEPKKERFSGSGLDLSSSPWAGERGQVQSRQMGEAASWSGWNTGQLHKVEVRVKAEQPPAGQVQGSPDIGSWETGAEGGVGRGGRGLQLRFLESTGQAAALPGVEAAGTHPVEGGEGDAERGGVAGGSQPAAQDSVISGEVGGAGNSRRSLSSGK